MHNIIIKDIDSNWTAWGKLVRDWIENPGNRPTTVGNVTTPALGTLRRAMADGGVTGIVTGPAARGVTFVDYSDAGNIVIPLPTKAMVRVDERYLDWVAMQAPGRCNYPLPSFYAVAFGGAAMVDLNADQLQKMGARRLGEYVINECM